jgi:ElaB/YqjD/DUF883 family membrane-anchored ribosome-binding protein
MNTNTEALSNFDTPTDESGSTTRKVADAAHKVIDESASRAENLERQLRRKAGEAQDKALASQRAASDQVERSLSQVESFVKDRPLAATGIAFAAGVLAAALLRR